MDLAPEMIVDLDEPIEWNGKVVTELTLREPKASEVLRANKFLAVVTPEAVNQYQMSLLGSVTGHPRQIIEQLPIRKLTEASNYLQGFISDGLETGETSSPT